MDTSVAVSKHCTNCALKFNNASQMFTNMRVGEEDNRSGTWEIEILDAIFYIYGFSARELAIAHLDNEYEEDSIESKDKLLETTNYINEKRISFCSSCVSVFNKVYTDHVQFRKLSKEDSLLRKAIKRFSPSKNIKLEVKSEENGPLTDEDTESLDIDFPNAPNIPVHTDPEEAFVRPCFVNICAPDDQDFNFDREEIDCSNEDFDEDVKSDPLGDGIFENVFAGEDMEKPSDIKRLSISIPPKNSGIKRRGKPKFSSNPQPLSSRVVHGEAIVPLAEGRVTRRRTYSLLPPEEKKNIKIEPTEEDKLKRRKRVKPSESEPQCISEEQRREIKRLLLRKIRKNRHWEKSKSRSREKRELAKRKAEMDKDTLLHSADPGNRTTPPEICPEKEKWKFVCSCGKRFKSFCNLKGHEGRVRHVWPSLKCDTCSQSFNRTHLMIAHKFKDHSDFGDYEEGLDACPICDKKFLWAESYKIHVETCRKENCKSFVCDKCGKAFSRLQGLQKHDVIHREEGLDKELFKCPQCGIKLKHSASLKKHIRLMHRMQKTFVCEQCGKTTKNMTNMRIHMKVHDESRAASRPYAYKPPKEVTKQNDTHILEGFGHPSTSGVVAAGLEMLSHVNPRTHL